MAHFAAAAVVSGMASAAGATGVVAAAGFDRACGPGGGEAGGPPGVKPPVKLRCARARPSTLMSVVCNVSIFPRSRREVHLYTHQARRAGGPSPALAARVSLASLSACSSPRWPLRPSFAAVFITSSCGRGKNISTPCTRRPPPSPSAPSLRARRISCHCRLLSDANRPAGAALATRGFSASGMAT